MNKAVLAHSVAETAKTAVFMINREGRKQSFHPKQNGASEAPRHRTGAFPCKRQIPWTQILQDGGNKDILNFILWYKWGRKSIYNKELAREGRTSVHKVFDCSRARFMWKCKKDCLMHSVTNLRLSTMIE